LKRKPNTMKKILYLIIVALLAAAVPAWGQNQTTNRTLGNIPDGWTVTVGGQEVPVTNGTAKITEGAHVTLTPPPANINRVKKVTLKDAPECRLIHLDTLTVDFVAQDCDTLTGELDADYPRQISIADGATVTLAGVTINGENFGGYTWAGITCEGDATIILKDDSVNMVKGFYETHPGIYVPVGKTLTIKGETTGTGSLYASSNGYGAGIGGGFKHSCGSIDIQGGNITATGGENAAGIGGGGVAYGNEIPSCGTVSISGGTITAQGGKSAAGIGSGNHGTCGAINISGGTITTQGGEKAAGIGSGKEASCGAITITTDVTQVTATKGENAPNSIGAGYSGSCGTVTIGGTVYWGPNTADPSTYEYKNGGNTYLAKSPLVYPTPIPTGAINGLFSVSSTKQVYFSQGNLKYDGSSWSFHTNQYDRVRTTNGYMLSYPMDLFCWGNVATPAYNGTSYVDGANDLSVSNGTDWGYNAISNGGNTVNSGWRTLTSSEWTWLLGSYDWGSTPNPGVNCRTSSTVNGVANARFAKAYLDTNSDGNGDVHGIIIFPDSYTHPDGVAAPTGINTVVNTSWNANKYNATDWGKMQTAGAVFLPAAGNRSVDYVGYVSANQATGAYWSSTYDETTDEFGDYNNAYYFLFEDGSLYPDDSNLRSNGYSVRLVKDAQ
jgi:hypothetical protein